MRSTQDRGSPKTLLNAKPGLFCVTKYEDGNWYRTRILAVYDSEPDGVRTPGFVMFASCYKTANNCIGNKAIIDGRASLAMAHM